MRFVLAVLIAVVVIVLIACGGGKRAITNNIVNCSPEPTPSPPAKSARRPTPGPTTTDAVNKDFGAALAKYYDAKYTAVYDICEASIDDGSSITGSLLGPKMARLGLAATKISPALIGGTRFPKSQWWDEQSRD